MKKKQPKLFILCAPTRGGKDAVARGLLRYHSFNLSKVVSHTTRPRRKKDKNARNYYFVNKTIFEKMIAKDMFYEWVVHNEEYYGISKREFFVKIKAGKNLLLVINIAGARKFQRLLPRQAIVIYLKPESLADIKRRFDPRDFTPRIIAKRLKIARREIREAPKVADYIVTNIQGELSKTVKKVAEVIGKELF